MTSSHCFVASAITTSLVAAGCQTSLLYSDGEVLVDLVSTRDDVPSISFRGAVEPPDGMTWRPASGPGDEDSASLTAEGSIESGTLNCFPSWNQYSLIVALSGPSSEASVRSVSIDLRDSLEPIRPTRRGLEIRAAAGELLVEGDDPSLALSEDHELELTGRYSGRLFVPSVRTIAEQPGDCVELADTPSSLLERGAYELEVTWDLDSSVASREDTPLVDPPLAPWEGQVVP